MTKTTEENFRDWHNDVFGCCYGSGEKHIVPALRAFLNLCRRGDCGRSYDFTEIEESVTPPAGWLLINVLCKADIIEYGTSPRYAWLTDAGVRLRDFMLSLQTERLIEVVTEYSNDYIHCYVDACNCFENHQEGRSCQNPFWR